MTVTDSDRQAAEESGGESRVRDIRWANRTVRVTTPVPTRVWAAVAAADPSTMPFHTPAWRECVSSGSGWRDASRLYELPGERQLVLMMARRPGRLVQASWPEGWGSGGVLAAGGVRPDEMALVCADLAKSGSLNTTVRPGFVAAPAWPSVSGGFSLVPRAFHVAHLGQSFEDFWSRSVSARTRSSNRAAWRSLEQAGVVITRGNSRNWCGSSTRSTCNGSSGGPGSGKCRPRWPGGGRARSSHSRSSLPWPADLARTVRSGWPAGRAGLLARP